MENGWHEWRKGKWGRGRGKKKIKGNVVILVDDDLSKRANFLSFKRESKNYLGLIFSGVLYHYLLVGFFEIDAFILSITKKEGSCVGLFGYKTILIPKF